jgi:SAM-dependent methyltransferase
VADPDTAVPFDLERLAEARGLCDWMFSQFEDAAHGNVVEIGAGIGTFSERILRNGVDRLLLVEPDHACARVLRASFCSNPSVRLLEEAVPGSTGLADHEMEADFVLCQNVLEHIEDDTGAVAAMAKVLRPGGQLGLLVPAHPRLFGALDRRYGHRRRYTQRRLEGVIRDAGLELRDLYSFNLLGAPGWWLANHRSEAAITARSLRLYELALGPWRVLEQRVRPPAGLSLIARAVRPARHQSRPAEPMSGALD